MQSSYDLYVKCRICGVIESSDIKIYGGTESRRAGDECDVCGHVFSGWYAPMVLPKEYPKNHRDFRKLTLNYIKRSNDAKGIKPGKSMHIGSNEIRVVDGIDDPDDLLNFMDGKYEGVMEVNEVYNP